MKSLIVGAMLLFAQSEVHNTVVRSIKYENFKGISTDDIAHRLKDRGIHLSVESLYEPQQVESARKVLQELIEERGRQGMEVRSEVRQIPPKSIELTFKAVKN
jgi:outer membrane protein assembly factor BamA